MEDIEKTTTISDETTPDEFEFGSLTPSSPSQQDSFAENSPADHFFFNGRLLPHSFPTTASNNSKRSSISRTASEYTSRSNSTNSLGNISSTSCSPRTSNVNNNNNNNSGINHRPLDFKPQVSTRGKTVNTTMKGKSTEVVTSTLYRSYSSQRWQYITPIPVKRSGGVRVCGGRNTKKKGARMKKKKKKQGEERSGSGVMKWWRRILMAAIFFCKECHALEGA